ncbi:MAG TPA: hypothetical protein VG778_03020 [Blastocatellia bacterium]|nr:hypothetical protein [Blastocatellia bacterium]
MRSLLNNWPKLVLVCVPLLIVVIDSAVLLYETGRPETEKAIRLVREGRSRKENFTVQQHLYATVYYRRTKGEAVTIEGWRAERSSDAQTPFIVEFSFTDPRGNHRATWGVNLEERTFEPLDDVAREFSWR